ncbi:MAG: inositol monophosphatase family protein [Microbacterium sp.]
MTSPSELLNFATEIAREAGELAHRRRREGVTIAATKANIADIVTEADREVEALVRSCLREARPDDGFLGEESGEAGGTSGITWVVDPIDGTVNYAFGHPTWAVSIAAVSGSDDPHTWQAEAGVVFAPALGEEYTAARGEGAFLGGERLRVTTEAPAGALLAVGISHEADSRQASLDELAKVMPLIRDIRRAGAASVDLAYVAAGRLDAYIERGLKPWDHAAGALLVTEAGGEVGWHGVNAWGKELLVAAEPQLHRDLVAALGV